MGLKEIDSWSLGRSGEKMMRKAEKRLEKAEKRLERKALLRKEKEEAKLNEKLKTETSFLDELKKA